MTVKENLFNQCCEFVEYRLQTIQHTILDIQTALQTETKSSVGDKHETGRAMLQLEREKTGNQLAEITKIKEALSKIDPKKTTKTIALGSVVYTTKANYFIAISAGEINAKGKKFYAISPNTPIGKLLIRKGKNDTIVFNQNTIKILKIE
ncbi:3-oxoacyl-ACP synthase [Pontimicrobium aquaticum]|uniref:3-oxoacyl-ACP synthase n=1 Tax=Pontimicrobium aquaticum TaxID=2565367 RepID=A0A4V5LQH5_9FLAO|nr:3-oxoacyl-ACP synthase [Pontimicrobium aquaticum]TJY34849.1 3-oxoacyl-ACP synthase [Pontimicrobium aquaticum]